MWLQSVLWGQTDQVYRALNFTTPPKLCFNTFSIEMGCIFIFYGKVLHIHIFYGKGLHTSVHQSRCSIVYVRP